MAFLSSFAQQMSYDDWKKEAATEINLQPEYGNVKKTKEQLEDDRTFIETVLKQDTTRRKGSEHLVGLGFNYLARGDMETAMKRFNQAWLLDPKNENAYWGLAPYMALLTIMKWRLLNMIRVWLLILKVQLS